MWLYTIVYSLSRDKFGLTGFANAIEARKSDSTRILDEKGTIIIIRVHYVYGNTDSFFKIIIEETIQARRSRENRDR